MKTEYAIKYYSQAYIDAAIEQNKIDSMTSINNGINNKILAEKIKHLDFDKIAKQVSQLLEFRKMSAKAIESIEAIDDTIETDKKSDMLETLYQNLDYANKNLRLLLLL